MAQPKQPTDLSFLNCGGTLSDRDIKLALEQNYLDVQSPYPLNIQPSSIDVHLGKNILVFARRRIGDGAIDLKKPIDDFMEYEVIPPNKGAVLHPREFILGVTEEWVSMPPQLSANVDGKSSLGRLGLVVHATAGFIDPGFHGHITLEITNLTEQPLIVYPGMPVGQIRFNVLTSPAQHLYGAKVLGTKKYRNEYSANPMPIASQYWKNFK